MSDRTVELRRLMVRTAPSESQMLAWLAEFEDRVRAEAASIDELREALAIIADWAHDCIGSDMPNALYGFSAIEDRARAALREGETK